VAFAAGTMFDAAHAAQDSQFVTTVPADVLPISVYYNEDVYDAQNNKIGDVNDILLDKDGRVAAVIVGVGGLLGVGEKDVAVPFNSLKVTEKDNDRYLVMNTTKESLEKAPGYTFDKEKGVWIAAPGAKPEQAKPDQAKPDHKAMVSDEQLMENLKGSAPAAILENATILNMGADGKMKPIKEGTNGWTCLDPGGEPMCADGAAMKWMGAYMEKKTPPKELGFVYMLKGDPGVSNTDPYAKEKTADNNWVQTGPHVMILGDIGGMAKAYPRDAKADPTKPYVMWPGTPYEHLMLPID